MLSIYYQVIMFGFIVLQSYAGFKIMPWPKEGFKDENQAAEFWIMRVIIPIGVVVVICPDVVMIFAKVVLAIAFVILIALLGIRFKKSIKR